MKFYDSLDNIAYTRLSMERELIKVKIQKLQLELSETETIFNLLDSIHNPKVYIQEVKSKSMGHRYIAKCRFLEPDGKTIKVIGFSVGAVDKYKGIDDENLINDAKVKATNKIRELYPIYFQ
jgi:hypothetical protein